MGLQRADLLSLSRPFLGAVVLREMLAGPASWLVLPCVAAAVATDMLDGRIARGDGPPTHRGRLIDNICDAVFLALAFCGFALQDVWSLPVWGSATRYWEHANWLPVIGLGVSFGLYMVRYAFSLATSKPLLPSRRGHEAGILNYVLAVVGGFAVLPGFTLTPWLLEPVMVTVALINLLAGSDNLGLLVQTWFQTDSDR